MAGSAKLLVRNTKLLSVLRSWQLTRRSFLLGSRQAAFPGATGMFDGRERRCSGATVMTRNQYHIRLGFGDAGSHRADAHLGDQFDVDPRPGVGVLKVVDELLDIFDGIDIVMRRWRDQPDTRC